ncbi:MAG: dipeptidase PepE [Acidobacteria bacterium]|nr:MAG: dipeptidase PepE [Acidobacteriota bacterium]
MRLLLISSSNVYGYGFLDHAEPEILRVLGGRRSIAFVPFAQHDHDAYTLIVRERFARMDVEVTQVRDANDIENAQAIFIGGGNTFRLLKAMYDRSLIAPIQRRVCDEGVPYIGSSAGTNVACPTIMTTNDMPIVYPPSFAALGLVRFQINPHYLDVDADSTHKGETREERILQFLEDNATPVIGLREGTMIAVENHTTTLLGLQSARLFQRGAEPMELEAGSAIAL